MSLSGSSSFRRCGQRDERRRRLLADDLSEPSDWSVDEVRPAESTPPKSEHYGGAEFLETQLRLVDLIPRRAIGLVLLLTAVAAIPVALGASYVWMLGRVAGGGAVAASLDLADKGSLNCWFSSLLLLAASATAALVYSIRRHRIDDYQGRYRIWLWAAICWSFMAADQAASLREGFRDLMIGLTGTPLVGSGALWWIVLYALIFGAVGSRLLLDMREHLFSAGVLLAAVIAQVVAIADRLGWILPQSGSQAVLFLTGAETVGNFLLFAAMLLHARFVVRDAEGLLPCREPTPDEECSEEETAADESKSLDSTGNRWRQVDPPHNTPRPTASFGGSTVSTPPTSSPISSPINRKLTKGEKKALKERLLRERLERQRRG